MSTSEIEHTDSTQTPQSGENSSSNQRQLNWPLFRTALLNNLRDGVIFVDPHGTIKAWSRELEVMTGMSANKVLDQEFVPMLLQVSDPEGHALSKAECPLARCLRTGIDSNGEYRITGRSGREVKVEISFTPVVGADGLIHGGVILIHDYTIQLDLQRQLKDLYAFSTLDPLTQVANRVEFERVLEEYVRAHQTTNFCCSLIICDIDFFKQINDNYNHHIGDQALVAFASLLKKFVRTKDVVARFGGEEFVILCANCDGAAAMQRAEEIRMALTQTPQPMLDGKCITASFGVSQLTPSDTPTDLFVRADTALLQAKEDGRNRVMCETGLDLDVPNAPAEEQTISAGGLKWRKIHGQILLTEEFKTHTSISLMVTKLRGYIMDKDADLRNIEENSVSMQVEFEDSQRSRDRGSFLLDIDFQVHDHGETVGRFEAAQKSTYIRITIREAKRKWFSNNAVDLAPFLLREVRDFLMISDAASRLSLDTATDPNKKR